MSTTITFINQKGGVGKTSLSFNFGIGLANYKSKVLFVDMDPQCNLSYVMRAYKPEFTIYDLLLDNTIGQAAIFHAPEGDIIPGSDMLSTLDYSLPQENRESYLRNALETVKDLYDYIIIDSPPTLGTVTVNILTAADQVIIPVLPDVFGIQGIGQLYKTIAAVRNNCNNALKITGIVMVRYSDKHQLSKKIETALKTTAEKMKCKLFNSCISESSIMSESQACRMSVFQYAPKSKLKEEFNQFIFEYLREEIKYYYIGND